MTKESDYATNASRGILRAQELLNELEACANCKRPAELLMAYKPGEPRICGRCANVRFNESMRKRLA